MLAFFIVPCRFAHVYFVPLPSPEKSIQVFSRQKMSMYKKTDKFNTNLVDYDYSIQRLFMATSPPELHKGYTKIPMLNNLYELVHGRPVENFTIRITEHDLMVEALEENRSKTPIHFLYDFYRLRPRTFTYVSSCSIERVGGRYLRKSFPYMNRWSLENLSIRSPVFIDEFLSIFNVDTKSLELMTTVTPVVKFSDFVKFLAPYSSILIRIPGLTINTEDVLALAKVKRGKPTFTAKLCGVDPGVEFYAVHQLAMASKESPSVVYIILKPSVSFPACKSLGDDYDRVYPQDKVVFLSFLDSKINSSLSTIRRLRNEGPHHDVHIGVHMHNFQV